ncbi:hypothetical protein O6H91_06G079800 [Diphasiastrum complanatum]|uniref:Uncharacterized protein n=2 Tax=Diphasiastrum complanatum TaxID=34168 RepID=A0ACC2DFE5_DIPCM|nr:hypothetical protein O6H91_06G079800 [Diphasiastrum complanatum]
MHALICSNLVVIIRDETRHVMIGLFASLPFSREKSADLLLRLISPTRHFHLLHSHPRFPFCCLHPSHTAFRVLHKATEVPAMSSINHQNVEEARLTGTGAELRAEDCIYLAAKSNQQVDYLERLTSGDQLGLVLPEGTAIYPANQMRIHAEDGGEFQLASFMESLNTSFLGNVLFYSPCLPSTHTFLSQNFHALPIGTVCIADSQRQGKGRAGNAWVSPKGCLMFSFTLQMNNGRILPFLQYVVTLAIVEAVEMVSFNKQMRAPDLRIKWPNDIYAKGMKIGGVLCTSTYNSSKFKIVIGIGLNVKNQEPTTCLDSLVHEFDSDANAFSREEILAAFLWKFESLYQVFLDQGFSALESTYYRYWLHRAKWFLSDYKSLNASFSISCHLCRLLQ